MNDPGEGPKGSGNANSYRDLVSVSRTLFFSSTFRDMHAERDLLRNDAFKELNERILRPRRHELNVIDLRQGVEVADIENEVERELAVLKVCLGEIDRTRPFLIGLLGDRYGWVPLDNQIKTAADTAGFSENVVGISVTELELLYAFFRNSEQQKRSRIYIRELDYSGMPDDVQQDYDERFTARGGTDAEQQAAADRWGKLKSLKARLLTEYPDRVRIYPASWDTHNQRVTGLETLRRMVVEDLGQDLEAHTREYEQTAPQTWQEADKGLLEDFVVDRTRCFVERPRVTAPATEFAIAPSTEEPHQPWGLCLTGESGQGKSAIFSCLYRGLKPKHGRQEVLLLAHAAGIHTGSEQIDRMLRRWIHELADYLGVDDPVDDAEADSDDTSSREYGSSKSLSAEDINQMFASLLGQTSTQTRVVLLIDAINQFERTPRGKYLTWLPKPWPTNARLLATAIPGDETETLGRPDQGYRCELRPVPPIDETEARNITTIVFEERYHRSVNEQALSSLLIKETPDGSPAFGNPLWLDLALQEINLLEADDYERADRELAHLPGAQRMEALLVSEAEALPPTVTGIYGELLGRAERTFGEDFTQAVIGYLALGRTGWRESDLEALVSREPGVAWSDLAFAGVRRSLGRHMVQRGEFGLWDFFHARLRETAMHRYLADASRQRDFHARLVDHLENLQEEDPLRLSEMMVHLIGSGDHARAALFFSRFWRGDAGLSDAATVLAEYLVAEPDGIDFADALLDADGISPDQAGRLASNMQFTVADALEEIAPLGPHLALLRACRNFLECLVEIDPYHAGWQRDLGVSIFRIGAVLSQQGNLGPALAYYYKSLTIREHLAESDPSIAVWQRDLGINLIGIGGLLAELGDLGEALEFNRQSTAVFRRLAESDSNNLDRQQDLGVSLERIGDVLFEQGHLGQALDSFRQSMVISESLVASEPSNAGWQHDLSSCQERMGNVLFSQGNLVEALDFFRQSLAVRRRLVESDPSKASWLRNLSVSENKIGDVLFEQGNLDEALKFHCQSIAIRERLAESDPSNAGWQSDLSYSQNRISDVLLEQGNLSAALDLYRQSMAIRERLVEGDPSNSGWQHDLSAGLDRIGDVLLEQDNLGEALEFYRQSLAIVQGLVQSDDSNAYWKHGLSVSLVKIGDVLFRQENYDDALESYRQSMAISEHLAERDPSDAGWQRGLSTIQDRISDVHLEKGNFDDALETYHQSLAVAKRLAESDPTNAGWQRDLSVSYNQIGNVLLEQGNLDDAVEFFQQSLAIVERLAKIDPSNAGWQRDLVVSYQRLAFVARDSGDTGEEQDQWHRCHAVLIGMRESRMYLDAPLQQLLSELDEQNHPENP